METGAWRAWDQLSPTIPHPSLDATRAPSGTQRPSYAGGAGTMSHHPGGCWTVLDAPSSSSLGREMVCDAGVRHCKQPGGKGSGRERQTPPLPELREATKIKLWTIF